MLLVTDVTGYVSKAVVAELAQKSVPVRVLAPEGAAAAATIVDPSNAVYPNLATNVEWIRGSACDAAALANAMRGVEAVFLATPLSPKMADEHLRVVTAAKSAGVSRVVQLSGVAADKDLCCTRVLRWLGQAEVAISTTALTITRLRPTFLMQNLLEFAPSIAQQGVIAGPFRKTRWTWVDARDVAAVAVQALQDSKHADQTYTVTGSEALSYQEVADRLSQVWDKPIRYIDITANEARGWLQSKGIPPVMIEAKLEMWDACASNFINVAPTDVVKEVTGRTPRSIEDFARDYRASFLN
ncbi:MAG TPA: NmrA family NAD(P)-binding protein [Steroidobacteraceae bacterium]